jgi:hypothetical protein
VGNKKGSMNAFICASGPAGVDVFSENGAYGFIQD